MIGCVYGCVNPKHFGGSYHDNNYMLSGAAEQVRQTGRPPDQYLGQSGAGHPLESQDFSVHVGR